MRGFIGATLEISPTPKLYVPSVRHVTRQTGRSSGRPPAGFAVFGPPLTFNVTTVNDRFGHFVKTLAFIIGLLIGAFGAVGTIAPAGLLWVAEHSATSSVFFVVAAVRVAFGLLLISVASVSRMPRTLRVLGYLILIVGITTALTGLMAIEGAHAIIEWWLRQGSGVIRLTGIPLLVLGGFVAYACAPTRRSA